MCCGGGQREGLVDKKPAGPDRPPLHGGGAHVLASTRRCDSHVDDGAARAIRLVILSPRALHSARARQRSRTPSTCCGGWR